MAYIKYKELTKYFNYFKSLDIDSLPQYVMDYIENDETIYGAYSTYRDKGIFTDKKIVLFDKKGLKGKRKDTHIIPYKAISNCSILYRKSSTDILIYLDSGYPLRLRFVKQKPEDKKALRILYSHLISKICSN